MRGGRRRAGLGALSMKARAMHGALATYVAFCYRSVRFVHSRRFASLAQRPDRLLRIKAACMGQSYERVHTWEKRLCDTYVRFDEVRTSTSPISKFTMYMRASVRYTIEQYTLTLHPSNA
jgi:hypothetical protein